MPRNHPLFMVIIVGLLIAPTLALAWMPMTQADVGGGGWLQSGCFHPTNSDVMVIGGDLTGGLYRTDDFGQSWRPWNNGLHNFDGEISMYAEDMISVVLENGQVEFFTATAGGIYRTLDGSDSQWRWSTRYEYGSADPHNLCYWLPPGDGQVPETSYSTAHRRAIPFSALSWDGENHLYAGAGRSRWASDNYETDNFPHSIVPMAANCVDSTYTVWALDVNEPTDHWIPMSGTQEFGSVRDLSVMKTATGDTTFIAVASRNGIYLYSSADDQWRALHDNALDHDAGWDDLSYGTHLEAWSIQLTQRGDLYVAMEKSSGDKASGVYCIRDVIHNPDAEWLFACDGSIVDGFSGSLWTMGRDGDSFVGWFTVPQFIYMVVQEGVGQEPDVIYLADRKSYFGFFVGTNEHSAEEFGQTAWDNTLRGYSPGHWEPAAFEAEEGWMKAWGTSVIFHPMLFSGEGPAGQHYLAIQFNARFHVSSDGGQTWQNAFCQGGEDNWISNGYNQHNNWRLAFMPDGRTLFTCPDTGIFRSTNSALSGFEWLNPEQYHIFNPYDNRIITHDAIGVAVQAGWQDTPESDPYDAVFACFANRNHTYGKLLMYRDPPGGTPEWVNVMVDDGGSPLVPNLSQTKFYDIAFAGPTTCFVTMLKYSGGENTAGVLRGTYDGGWTWEDITGDIPYHRSQFRDILVNHHEGTRVFVATPWAGASNSGGVWVLDDIAGDQWSVVDLTGGTDLKFRNMQCLAQSDDGSRVYAGAGTSTYLPGALDSGVIKCNNPAAAADPASWEVLETPTGFGYAANPPIWIDDMPANWDLTTQMYHVSALAVSPANPDVVFCGLNGFGFASVEGIWMHDGNSWNFKSEGEPYNGAGVLRLAFNPHVSGQFVMGTLGLGLLFKDNMVSGVGSPFAEETSSSSLLSFCRKEGATGLRFALTNSSTVELRIFDVRGHNVRTMILPHLPSGEHVLSWDGRGNNGAAIASGIYMARLKVQDETRMMKMLLVR